MPDGLLTPADVRSISAAVGIRPTKRRGQNFLVDPNTVRRLVRLAGVEPDETVLEIGPGLGSLTLGLLPAARRVVAVELDEALATALPATVTARLGPAVAARLTVLAADGLRLEPADISGDPPSVLAANLPYNVAVPLLLGVLERFPSVRRGLVMVQAEVADRLTASPGGRVYGVPSVKMAWYASARPAGPVPRAVFWPQPNVDSSLVAFTRHDRQGSPRLRRAVFAVVDAAFAQRRKTLRAALSGWAGSADQAERLALAAGIDPSARGEILDVAAFTRLAIARLDPSSEPE
ncbi:16S rRNA (adenine(1518)-N(6)/adenine(1519)-N(6))-dimethyltransferase [Protofrankia sp. BMG5.30]|uniref:Ribosomal RNA small subunit methyltransferase A n=1 Tax=Protofrankia coriariae TaxID=1562887 RepID=A0ABR5F8V9_9ACTN|nr:16S rRNA methyltransferase [Protofrankia coriariae]ONH38195.1 16S rRNA (adenine(1518)-N(6)/adenine(1519)-N(6))-dimethyltransferase [Protofrankia sp. BMG5.30]